MLRYLTSFCIVVCLSLAIARGQHRAIAATTTRAADQAVPAEIRKLKGEAVKIYHDVNLLGGEKPSVVHTQYLVIVLEKAGVTVVQSRGVDEKKQEPKPDLVILGEMTEAKFDPAELADPFVANLAKRQQQAIQKYNQARPKLEQDAAAAGARVIKYHDVAAALGIHATEAQMVEALNARARESLKRVLPEFKADAMSLSDILDFLRDESKADIFVNWRALEAAGVDRKAPLGFESGAEPLSEVLDKLLGQVSGGKDAQLDYDVDEGVIVISTRDELKKQKPPAR
jgi:hypothetical protein